MAFGTPTYGDGVREWWLLECQLAMLVDVSIDISTCLKL